MKFDGSGIDKVIKSGPTNRVVKFVIEINKIKHHPYLLLYLLPYRLKLRAIYIMLIMRCHLRHPFLLKVGFVGNNTLRMQTTHRMLGIEKAQ